MELFKVCKKIDPLLIDFLSFSLCLFFPTIKNYANTKVIYFLSFICSNSFSNPIDNGGSTQWWNWEKIQYYHISLAKKIKPMTFSRFCCPLCLTAAVIKSNKYNFTSCQIFFLSFFLSFGFFLLNKGINRLPNHLVHFQIQSWQKFNFRKMSDKLSIYLFVCVNEKQ